jgi:hypothetical protein
MPRVRDTEIMKIFIMSQTLSLCLMGYAWLGKPSSRSLSKWSISGHAWRLPLCAVVMMNPMPEPPAFSSLPPSWPIAIVAH